MTTRKLLLGVLSATVVLTAVAYQSDTSAAGQSSAPAPSPSGSSSSPYSTAAVPDGWKKIGSSVNGLSVAIPKGWVGIDPTAADLKKGLERAGIKGPSLTTLESNLEQLKGLNALFAVDSATASSGYATNLNGFCENISAPIAKMKDDARNDLTQVGATNVEITETTVAGQPAVRLHYHVKVGYGALEGLQVQIPVAGGKTCVLTVTALEGAFPSSADQILSTFTKL